MSETWVYQSKLDERERPEESLSHAFTAYEHSEERLGYIIGNLAELLVEKGVISGPEAVNALLLQRYYKAVPLTTSPST